MVEILRGCPLLEDLSLEDCYGLHKLNLNNPNTKKLALFLGQEDTRLKLSCPNVMKLDINGWIEHLDIVNASSVVDASLYFWYNFKYARKEYREIKMLLEKLRHARIFMPCTWCILVLTIWKVTNQPCPSFNWKCLVIKTSLTKWHLPGLASLLRNSPCLEMLTMYINPSSTHQAFQGEGKWIQSYDFDGESYWKSQDSSFHCLIHHLRTVVVFGFITEPYVIQMAEFLLKNAMVLERIVISNKRGLQHVQQNLLTSEELLALSKKLLSIRRASSHAVIHLE